MFEQTDKLPDGIQSFTKPQGGMDAKEPSVDVQPMLLLGNPPP